MMNNISTSKEDAIFNTIKVMGPITAKDISELTGINSNTVRTIVIRDIKPKHPELKSNKNGEYKGYYLGDTDNTMFRKMDDAIIDYLKSQKGKPVTSTNILSECHINYSKAWMNDHLSKMKAKYPNIRTIPKKGYTWFEPAEELKEETPKKPFKNHEGYPDPTAGNAIMNVEKEDYDINKYDQRIGDIWKLERTPYSNKERFSLILALSPGCASTLDVVSMDDFYDDKYCVIVDADLPGKYYVDTRKVMQRSYKQFYRQRTFITDSVFNYILTMIGKYLRISPEKEIIEKVVEVPVEKIVEKVVEVPVEKIVEIPAATNGVYLSETDYALLKQRADIYEKAFYAVTCGGVEVEE